MKFNNLFKTPRSKQHKSHTNPMNPIQDNFDYNLSTNEEIIAHEKKQSEDSKSHQEKIVEIEKKIEEAREVVINMMYYHLHKDLPNIEDLNTQVKELNEDSNLFKKSSNDNKNYSLFKSSKNTLLIGLFLMTISSIMLCWPLYHFYLINISTGILVCLLTPMITATCVFLALHCDEYMYHRSRRHDTNTCYHRKEKRDHHTEEKMNALTLEEKLAEVRQHTGKLRQEKNKFYRALKFILSPIKTRYQKDLKKTPFSRQSFFKKPFGQTSNLEESSESPMTPANDIAKQS